MKEIIVELGHLLQLIQRRTARISQQFGNFMDFKLEFIGQAGDE